MVDLLLQKNTSHIFVKGLGRNSWWPRIVHSVMPTVHQKNFTQCYLSAAMTVQKLKGLKRCGKVSVQCVEKESKSNVVAVSLMIWRTFRWKGLACCSCHNNIRYSSTWTSQFLRRVHYCIWHSHFLFLKFIKVNDGIRTILHNNLDLRVSTLAWHPWWLHILFWISIPY